MIYNPLFYNSENRLLIFLRNHKSLVSKLILAVLFGYVSLYCQGFEAPTHLSFWDASLFCHCNDALIFVCYGSVHPSAFRSFPIAESIFCASGCRFLGLSSLLLFFDTGDVLIATYCILQFLTLGCVCYLFFNLIRPSASSFSNFIIT